MNALPEQPIKSHVTQAKEPAPAVSDTLYRELRRVAAGKMRHEHTGHTLQPTALVGEAYLRLAGANRSMWGDRARVLGTAAHVMRQILVDHARAHRAGKRGGGAVQVTFDEGLQGMEGSVLDVLAVDTALARLAEFDLRQAKVLELRFFAGLTIEEIAEQLEISERTAKRDWKMARAWLRHELSPVK